jgi:hypothetical protein
MQVAVSYNKKGEITLMFQPSTLTTGKYIIGYEPARGEQHHVMDVPKPFEGKPLTELAGALRVNNKGKVPKLEARTSKTSKA